MTDEIRARNRYFAMTGVRIAAVAGALLGLILIARAHDWTPKLIGTGIVLSAMWVIAVVPRALAHRWRTPPQ